MDLPFLGYPLATLLGIVMGLLGAGGGILTLPIMIFTLDVPPVQATAYSLFVVGIAASLAAWRQYKAKNVALKTGLIFAIPSMLGVLIARVFVVPFLPDVIIDLGPIYLTKDHFLLLVFAGLMMAAAWFMLFPVGEIKPKFSLFRSKNLNFAAKQMIALEGLGVGILTGMVGAGGGFIIVPVLLLIAGLSMRKAVGTSLFIIAIKSVVGFGGDLIAGTPMDWQVLAGFTSATLVGVLASEGLHKKISPEQLKTIFGYFVMGMGVLIALQQVYSIVFD